MSFLDLKASTRRKWRLSGRTLPPKHTEALSSNNSTEHSAVKVLLRQQFGFFRLSYSGKVYFVAVPGKLGVSQAVQPGQPDISFLFGEELIKLWKYCRSSNWITLCVMCAYSPSLHLLWFCSYSCSAFSRMAAILLHKYQEFVFATLCYAGLVIAGPQSHQQ